MRGKIKSKQDTIQILHQDIKRSLSLRQSFSYKGDIGVVFFCSIVFVAIMSSFLSELLIEISDMVFHIDTRNYLLKVFNYSDNNIHNISESEYLRQYLSLSILLTLNTIALLYFYFSYVSIISKIDRGIHEKAHKIENILQCKNRKTMLSLNELESRILVLEEEIERNNINDRINDRINTYLNKKSEGRKIILIGVVISLQFIIGAFLSTFIHDWKLQIASILEGIIFIFLSSVFASTIISLLLTYMLHIYSSKKNKRLKEELADLRYDLAIVRRIST